MRRRTDSLDFCVRAIYDQSFEDVAWHVGDNNGMPLDNHQHPTSDLAKSIAQSNSSNEGSISNRVKSALKQAVHMDTAPEPPPSRQGSWQKGSALQTLALDEHELPIATPDPQVGLLPC